jgi:hypothetical protein
MDGKTQVVTTREEMEQARKYAIDPAAWWNRNANVSRAEWQLAIERAYGDGRRSTLPPSEGSAAESKP